MFEGTDGVLDGVRQLVAVEVELLQLLDLSEGVPGGLDVRDQVLLQVEVPEAWQPSENVSFNNLDLVSLRIREVKIIFSMKPQ